MTNIILSCLIGYILGSFNFAFIIGKMKGIDIREKGTGNAGASNALLTMGKLLGVLVAVLDIIKGFLAVWLCRKLFGGDYCPYLGGIFAVLGHIFPLFMRFKGGKGFATYIGMGWGIDWRLGIGLMAMTIVITLITDYIWIATLTTAFVTPLWLYTQGVPYPVLAVYAVLALIMLYKHRINIERLRNHEEIGMRAALKKKTQDPV